MSDPAPDSAGADFDCANCGQRAHGAYCPACGQRQFVPGDLGLRHAWHHVVHELVHLDGKIFNTLKLLFTSPGTLSLDFLEGRRARHIHPIRLFLVIGVVFFFFAKVNPPFDVGALYGPNLGPNAMRSIDQRAQQAGITREQLLARAGSAVVHHFKSISLVGTGVGGFVLWALFRRRRAYLSEHLVVTLHLASFNMAVWFTLGWLNRIDATKAVIGYLLPAIVLGYFLLAARRVYGGPWWALFLKWLVVELCKGIVALIGITFVWVRALTG